MRKTHQAGHAFKYPKDASAAALDLASIGIYERMVTVVVYDFDPETNTMSAASAAAILSRGENVVRGKPVFCQLPGLRQRLSRVGEGVPFAHHQGREVGSEAGGHRLR